MRKGNLLKRYLDWGARKKQEGWMKHPRESRVGATTFFWVDTIYITFDYFGIFRDCY